MSDYFETRNRAEQVISKEELIRWRQDLERQRRQEQWRHRVESAALVTGMVLLLFLAIWAGGAR